MAEFPMYDDASLWQSLPQKFFDVAAAVGDCVAIGLRDTAGTSGAPSYACYPNFGELAWDNCDCGGALQISLGRRATTLVFPNEADGSRPSPCGGGYPMQDYTMEYITCFPTVTSTGKPPKCEEMVHVTRKLQADITAIRKALFACLCALKSAHRIDDFIVRASQPAGPNGACAGWSTTFTVAVATLG
jgi:hypothetical protein